MEYDVLKVSRGWVAVLGSERGLARLALPHAASGEALLCVADAIEKGATKNPARFQELARRLDKYFLGEVISFTDELDFPEATPFQVSVWQAAREIGYGETKSYGWLAGKVGRPGGARAVGQALGKNPLPIIVPCHRVIGSGGELRGFSGGLDWKKELLKIEAGKFEGGCIPFK